jgi:hypothetical protein
VRRRHKHGFEPSPTRLLGLGTLAIFLISAFAASVSLAQSTPSPCALSTFVQGHTRYVRNSCYYEIGISLGNGDGLGDGSAYCGAMSINYTAAIAGTNESMVSCNRVFPMLSYEIESQCTGGGGACEAEGSFSPNRNITLNVVSSSSSEIIIDETGLICPNVQQPVCLRDLVRVEEQFVFVSDEPYFSDAATIGYDFASPPYLSYHDGFYSGYTGSYNQSVLSSPDCLDVNHIGNCAIGGVVDSSTDEFIFSPTNASQPLWYWTGTSRATEGNVEGYGVALMGMTYGSPTTNSSYNPSKDELSMFSRTNEMGFRPYGEGYADTFGLVGTGVTTASFLLWVDNTPYTSFQSAVNSLLKTSTVDTWPVYSQDNGTYVFPVTKGVTTEPVLVGTNGLIHPFPITLYPVSDGVMNAVGPYNASVSTYSNSNLGLQIFGVNSTLSTQNLGSYSVTDRVLASTSADCSIQETVDWHDLRLVITYATSADSDKINVTGSATALRGTSLAQLYLAFTLFPDSYGNQGESLRSSTAAIPAYYTFNYTDYGTGFIFPNDSGFVYLNDTSAHSDGATNLRLYFLNNTQQAQYSAGQQVGNTFRLQLEFYSPLSSFDPSNYRALISREMPEYYSQFPGGAATVGLRSYSNVSSVSGNTGNTLSEIAFWRGEDNRNYQFYYTGVVGLDTVLTFSNRSSVPAVKYYNPQTRIFSLDLEGAKSIEISDTGPLESTSTSSSSLSSMAGVLSAPASAALLGAASVIVIASFYVGWHYRQRRKHSA